MPTGKTNEQNPGDWFDFAQERWLAARLVWSEKQLAASATELLQEAIERYLKGYLIANGWSLVRTHDLAALLKAATNYDAEFQRFASMTIELTENFFAQHYPGGDLTEIAGDYENLQSLSGELIELIEAKLPHYFKTDAVESNDEDASE